MKIDKFDIVALKDKVVQYLGKEMDNGAIVQDIHCRKELIHVALIQRKATSGSMLYNTLPPPTKNIMFFCQ